MGPYENEILFPLSPTPVKYICSPKEENDFSSEGATEARSKYCRAANPIKPVNINKIAIFHYLILTL